MEDEIRVKIKGGYIRAIPSEDPDYPGIWVEVIRYDEPEDVVSRPMVLVEQPAGTDLSRVLIWDNPDEEDYQHEITFAPLETKYFKIGDVEKVDEETCFIRLWFNETQRKELNEKFNAEFSSTEWITLVVNLKTKEVSKAVALCEAQNKEYDVMSIFTKEDLRYYVENMNIRAA